MMASDNYFNCLFPPAVGKVANQALGTALKSKSFTKPAGMVQITSYCKSKDFVKLLSTRNASNERISAIRNRKPLKALFAGSINLPLH